ncbi:hypothetical protein D3C72_835710 [compost metagenome]
MIKREIVRVGEVYDSPSYRAHAYFFQYELRGGVGNVRGIDSHIQRLGGGDHGGGQVLASRAVQQAGDEAAAERQVRHGKLMQVFHGAELLRQPRYANPGARAGHDVTELAQVGPLFHESHCVGLDDQAHCQGGAVGQHAFEPGQKRTLRE